MLLLRVSDGSGRGGSSVGFNGGQSRRMMVLGMTPLAARRAAGRQVKPRWGLQKARHGMIWARGPSEASHFTQECRLRRN